MVSRMFILGRLAWLLFLVLDPLHSFGRTTGPEPAIDERIEIAVHDRLHIAGFNAGAEIFHHAIGLEDIAANLVSPGNAPFFAVEALHLLLLRVDPLRIKF